MAKRYVVNLTSEERSTLEKLVNTGRASAKKQIHARILLKADISAEGPGCSDRQICEALEVSSSCVERVRKRLVEEGLEAALNRRPSSRPSRRRLDGEQEARLVALACSTPPQGHGAWTLRLLADQMVAGQSPPAPHSDDLPSPSILVFFATARGLLSVSGARRCFTS